MKKVAISMITICLIAVFATPSHAALRADRERVKGTAVWIDKDAKEITIETGERNRTFKAEKYIDPALSVGNESLIIFRKGTNLQHW